MILLDSNVISEIMLPNPDARVVSWLDRQPGGSIWTTSITVYEIRFGLQSMPIGRKQSMLTISFERWLASVVQQRVMGFDDLAARQAADLGAARKKRGRPVDSRDTMIAGIVLAAHATLATRNVRHFEDISASVINPWVA
jgi:toxin FitB